MVSQFVGGSSLACKILAVARLVALVFRVAIVRLSIRRYSADHIVRRQRPPDPLQLELTDGLDLHGILDLRSPED